MMIESLENKSSASQKKSPLEGGLAREITREASLDW
jgi:hypothetical protein